MRNKGVRNHEKGFSNGKGQTTKRPVEALSCYNQPCEECHGAADSWYVHSIVKLFVKVQAKQVKGAISLFKPGLLPALPSTANSFHVPHEKARLSSSPPPPIPITISRSATHCFPFLVLPWCSNKPSFLRNFFPQPHDGPSSCELPHTKVFSVCCACSCRVLSPCCAKA